jgi:hypothetical protein
VPPTSPVPSPVQDFRAWSWRAVAFSAGGDGDGKPLPSNSTRHIEVREG